MKKRNVFTVVTLSSLIVMTALTGCSKSTEEASSKPVATGEAKPSDSGKSGEKALEPVELTWYYPGTVQKDAALIQEEINKITKAKINATVKLSVIDWGAYDQKMNVINATNEPYDLAFTSSWTNNYYQNVAKGSFAPLDELLTKYAPKLKSSMPAQFWDATKVDNKIYGIINQQIFAKAYGVFIRKDLADKYGLDIKTVKKSEDLEPFFDQVLKGEKGITPLALNNEVNVTLPYKSQFDTIGDQFSPGVVMIGDKGLKVVNQYETPEMKAHFEDAKKWFDKGYIKKDVTSTKRDQADGDMKAGKYAALINVVKPGGEQELKSKYGFEFVSAYLEKPIVSTEGIISTLNAISKSSKNPERAMMFMELMNTDKQLYNLISHGIENKHYVKVADNVIGMPSGVTAETNSYNPNSDWMFGNQFNGYYTDKSQVGAWEATQKLNNEAAYSDLLGFSFNPEPVNSKIAQVTTVLNQYLNALQTGTSDPNTLLPQLIQKLKAAGGDDIVKEKQAQIDKWKASKK
ncbi:DUF3502 domain-containing protein [Paenibacillus sp. LMG 31461]|uniref:DUF3502 domain-containing protein n=1 Tax=Paenibacillus plantarum TaxID=2654975 RepID=A0ABX1X2Z0_9BACL|nr:ABC transporter substrate-binding protein [Paenibacillus plantarum]NOU62506.1 DUF3502 domain-containing protein [Paenibacillus plantarum]